jgi:L-threonylcarbamoyladenylate synthase
MKKVEKLNMPTNRDKFQNAPTVFSRHYTPTTETYLTNNISELLKCFKGKKIGILVFQNQLHNNGVLQQEILSKSGDINEAAKNLYAAMHRLDQNNLDVIIAERLPEIGLGKTINNNLERSTKKD